MERDAPPNDANVEQFVRLLSAQERRLYAYILSLVPNWADADVIAQETRIRLWQQFDQYDAEKDFGAWARTIAHFLILAHRKKCQREHAHLSKAALAAVAQRVTSTIDEFGQRQESLARCLETLDERQRSLLMRYYSGDEDRRAIAADLGRSYVALRKTVQRLRNSLGRCIEAFARQEARQ